MTPKEKAEELYFKYKEALNIRHDMRIGANPFAKECVLIAVDEILEELDHLPFDDQDFGTSKMKYWQEVKKEIELL